MAVALRRKDSVCSALLCNVQARLLEKIYLTCRKKCIKGKRREKRNGSTSGQEFAKLQIAKFVKRAIEETDDFLWTINHDVHIVTQRNFLLHKKRDGFPLCKKIP